MRGPNDQFRLTQDLKRELGELSFSGPTAGAAFRTALASILSMLAAMMLHLDKPYWAAITAVSIVLPDITSSLARSVDRCLGTVAGAIVGYFGAHFVVQGLAPSPDILPAINRLVGIVGGIVVVMVAQAFIAPLVARVLHYLLAADADEPGTIG
jgi:hypothetical protein